jgi:hypothetical protein
MKPTFVARNKWLFLFAASFLLVAVVLATGWTLWRSAASENFDVVATDQASRKILVLDPDVADWSSEEAVKWSWAPSSRNGFENLTYAWGLPSGVKLRKNKEGLWLVVTDSRGLAAIVPYPAGDSKKWGLNVGGNPHEAELLPNGNIAVAASTGGWVRIYTASQGPSSSKYTEFPLSGAHGVLWDPGKNVLWALGDYYLVALQVEGTDSEPTIREVLRKRLLTNGGHDLQPVYGDPDRLWVTTGSHVYQYVKSTNTWDATYPGNALINRGKVKSIGSLKSGQVLSTVPKPGCQSDWCTDTVDFFAPEMQRTRKGAAFYKARFLNPDYQ